MEVALAQARQAATHQDVPIGAVIVGANGELIATGRNRRELDHDPTAHAEMLALRSAAQLLHGGWRLNGCTLVVTLEPCVMCAGAIVAARVDRLVFGAWDDKAGACGSVWDFVRDTANLHQIEVLPGVLAGQSAALLREFFGKRRPVR